MAQGSVFTSETDAEVIAHLIAECYARRPGRRGARRLRRARGPLRVRGDEPRRARRARRGAQGVPADHRPRRGRAVHRLGRARRSWRRPGSVQYLENGEIVVLRPDGRADHRRPTASRSSAPCETVDWDQETAEKGGFETFMLKEIHEQADAVAETIADRTARGDGVDLDEEGALDEAILRRREADRGRGLRHRLPRRSDRPLRDRGVGAAAGRARHRLRVPLPQPGRRSQATS